MNVDMKKTSYKIKLLISGLFILCIGRMFSQNTSRIFKEAYVKTDNVLVIKVNDGTYEIKFYNSQIIETTFIPKGEDINRESHAVIMTSVATNTTLNDTGLKLNFSSKNLRLEIQKSPFKISYFYNDELITSEKRGYYKTGDNEAIEFQITESEVLYGGGARALGMNRRGHRLQLYNKAHYGYETHSELMNYTMPLVLSSKRYMLHFDNAPIGYLDLDSKNDNTLTYETISGRKTYQVIVADSWYNLIDEYTNLTGKQPMLPRWALGNFSSRFGYHSQQETERTIQAFKHDSIPVDTVILDLYWFGKTIKGTMGNLEVYKDSFPEMSKMVRNFKRQGVKTILITEPFILKSSSQWNTAVKHDVLAKDSIGNPYTYDFYFGNTGLIDIYNPKGKQWFWNIYKELKELGIAGIWGDLGEPEVHPNDLYHATARADEVHNIYGHDWARLIYEGYQNDYPNERPFILMRAGYSGSQRFGLVPWSGDVNRTWGGLQSQPEIALQMGLQGLAFMHSDLGGFAGPNLDDELYARWLQYGVFQPIFRPHAQEEVPSEPVFRAETAKQLAKQAIALRYQLLPYNYNLVFENNQTGVPLMRPLFFEDNTSKLLEKSSTYLWGHDFLITPVTQSEITKVPVYFPKNALWFDFYTDAIIKGGQSLQIATTPKYIPTYVRAGAFIPKAALVQTIKDYSLSKFELHYYYHESISESKRTLYHDDGITAKAFEKDQYELLVFKANAKKSSLTIELKSEIGHNYTSEEKQLTLILHNIKQQPKNVFLDKKQVDFIWNKIRNTMTIPVIWNPSTTKKITVKL